MENDDTSPEVIAELQRLRAEVALLRAHAAAAPDASQWLPKIHDGHLVLPRQHYRMMQGLRDGRELWRRHPHVRTGNQLTFGERSADVMRNAFGSWAFVGSFLAFMAVWMTVNSLVLGRSGFDHYPYLNTSELVPVDDGRAAGRTDPDCR